MTEELKSTPEATLIKTQIATQQQQNIALRDEGLRLEQKLQAVKNEMFKKAGAINILQELLKEIEN